MIETNLKEAPEEATENTPIEEEATAETTGTREIKGTLAGETMTEMGQGIVTVVVIEDTTIGQILTTLRNQAPLTRNAAAERTREN